MTKKVLKTLIPSIMLVIVLVSFLPINILEVKAEYTTSTTWNGNENARDINQFGGSFSTMMAYRIWSVCKEAKMSDEEAAGIMANMRRETGRMDPECVEGHYGFGDTLESVAEYIDKYSAKATDPKSMEKLGDESIKQYGVSDEEIALAKAGRLSSAHGLDLGFYYSAGYARVGIGLIQFTGEEQDRLFDFMKQHDVNWWEVDNQLIFMFSYSDQGGYSKCGEKLEAWRDENYGKTPEECAYSFQKLCQLTGAEDLRRKYAREIYTALAGKGWDSKYGQEILNSTFFKGGKRILTHEGIEDRGLLEDIAGKAVEYPRNTGFIFALDDRNQKNKTVWKDYFEALKSDSQSGGDTTYSLFELYGEDVHWYNYFGENSHVPLLMDHIYSAYVDDMTDELGFKDVFYTAYNYLSCRVYPDRPTVLTQQDLKNGLTDPRVSASTESISAAFKAYTYISGSIKLAISKFIVSLTSFLMGPELREYISSVITDLENSSFWEILKTPLLIVVSIAIVVWIITFSIKAVRYVKNGDSSIREIITRFITLIVCVGLIFFAIASPSACNKTVDIVLNFVDETFNFVLKENLEGDDIVGVNDSDKAAHAAIWKNAIFEPWVMGQFGYKYKELYTNYATDLKSGESAMPQSNQTESPNPLTDEPYFNSTKLTGDVYVYAGNGKYIRNWAAYLYSTGSSYHIDSTVDKTVAEQFENIDSVIFPNYTQKTTANDGKLYADLFRVIDAQMDISPQHYPDGEVINNYTNSRELDPNYLSQGTIMLFNCLLLLPLYPVIFQKLISFIRLLISLLKVMYYAIVEIFKEKSGLGEVWPDIKKNFLNYVLASIKLMILVTIYYLLVNNGILLMIVYLLIAWAVLNIKIDTVRQGVNRVKRTAQAVKKRFI